MKQLTQCSEMCSKNWVSLMFAYQQSCDVIIGPAYHDTSFSVLYHRR